MTLIDLLNNIAMARSLHPERPRIDMSDMADAELVKKMVDKVFSGSAVDELVERANGKCMTLAEYLRDVVREKQG
jgi:hypothetical protein